MRKIVLTAINAKYSHSNPALLYLRTALSDHRDTECIIIEWDINQPRRQLLEKLVGPSNTIFLFSAYIWNSNMLKDLIPDLSILQPDAIIAAGGPEAVCSKQDWLEIPGIDYIFDGNAEDFAPLLQNLKKPEKPEVLTESKRPFKKTPFPYTRDFISALKGKIIYYEASRGCRFNCSYCLSAADNEFDCRTGKQITEEIRMLCSFEGTVKFVDRTFNADSSRARLVWKLMVENPPAGCFHFELHPMLLRDEDFELISRLPEGCAQFEIGIQSTNPSILANVNRADNWNQSRESILRLIEMRKFHIHLDQIVGLPGDTPESASESLDEIMSLKPDRFQLGFLKLLPGTPLAAAADKFGIQASSTPPYEVLRSDSFSFEELQYFHRIEELINLLYNSGFFPRSLPVISKAAGGWFQLFKSILNFSEISDRQGPPPRRWEYWGRILFDFSVELIPNDLPLIKDLLRLDWCPFAGAQRYPDFIRYADDKKMNRLKAEACCRLQSEQPAIPKSALHRAILFIPESDNSLHPAEKPQLFIKHNGKIKRFTPTPLINYNYHIDEC